MLIQQLTPKIKSLLLLEILINCLKRMTRQLRISLLLFTAIEPILDLSNVPAV